MDKRVKTAEDLIILVIVIKLKKFLIPREKTTINPRAIANKMMFLFNTDLDIFNRVTTVFTAVFTSYGSAKKCGENSL